MVTPQLLEFLRAWEGPPHLAPQQDRVNPRVWDYGYGHVCDRLAKPLPSIDAAVALLVSDAEFFAAGVRRLVKVSLEVWQFEALNSFAFNEGLDEDHDGIAEGLGDSTLLRLVNAGRFNDAAGQFKFWNIGGGRVVRGLDNRRAAERAMFVNADYSGRP